MLGIYLHQTVPQLARTATETPDAPDATQPATAPSAASVPPPARLLFHTDAGLHVWLNGRTILMADRAAAARELSAELLAPPGHSLLLIMATPASSGLHAQLVAVEDDPSLPNLTAGTHAPPADTLVPQSIEPAGYAQTWLEKGDPRANQVSTLSVIAQIEEVPPLPNVTILQANDALVVVKYRILRPPVPTTVDPFIYVVHWGLEAGQPTSAVTAAPGTLRSLSLNLFENHPALRSFPLSHTEDSRNADLFMALSWDDVTADALR